MPFRILAAVLLSLLAVPRPVAAQGQAVHAEPERAAAEQRLAAARATLSATQDGLQALVEGLADDFAALTGGPDASDLKNRLALAMLDMLPAAEARFVTAQADGRRATRATRARILREVFDEPITAAAPIAPRMAQWVARRVAEGLAGLASFDGLGPRDVLREIDAVFVPGETWYQCWNRAFHLDLPEARSLADAQAEYESAGLALDRLRFPERYGPRGERAPPGMVVVPGGTYELGPNNGFKRPGRKLNLQPFALDRREVTQREYATFVESQPMLARAALLPRGWVLDASGRLARDEALSEHPVQWVSWEQAAAYAAWVGKRLPNEDEWEAAAAGPAGRAWPWGDEFRAGMANGAGASSGTLPVESFPQSSSAAGCFDMAGNVWEWTATLEDGSTVRSLPDGPVNLIIRGGGWRSERDKLTTRYRWIAPGKATFAHPAFDRPIGFRCALDL